ncbi:MAG: c-type cytochrome [Candidatus Loosdrechtia sp.]|uniref:c-type cytochrome n=1 Tax=Candidatus Loosdrechtia sp. TaxID=3101272 RepID=UPI003A6FF861|nr:MAG: c-type cytochrome [Candidatus Jettenia sp. AMX2]
MLPPKKEEEKTYSGAFAVTSFILVIVTVWAIYNETVERRPWKRYQEQYNNVKYKKIKEAYEKDRAFFEQEDIQKEYRKTKNELERARKEFEDPSVQKEYKDLLVEKNRFHNELEKLRFEATAVRNERMEKVYLYGKEKNEDMKRQIEQLEDRDNTYNAKIQDVKRKLTDINNRINEIRNEIDSCTDRLQAFTAGLEKYKRQLANLEEFRPDLQRYQIYLTDIDIVDRCMSCHVGINEPEGVSEKQPYTSHPDREVYLGNHPPEKFGCVLCHGGQASATTSVKKAHGEVEYWLTPLYRGKSIQSSCLRCHYEGREVKGAEILWEGKRLFEELGCYGCHETKGTGRDKNRMIGPDLYPIKEKVKPWWITQWLKDPKEFRPTTSMPDFGLSTEESQAIAAYLWQNANEIKTHDKKAPSFNEEQLKKGMFLFEHTGCIGCHPYKENTKREFAPGLSRIGEKTNYAYMVDWIMNPKEKQPMTRMPDFRLKEENAHLIAGYLMKKTSENIVEEYDTGWLENEDLAEEGRSLIKKYGCFGCHGIPGMEGLGEIGAELSAIGSKYIQLFDFGLLEKKILHEAGLDKQTENVGLARKAWLRAKLKDPRQFDKGRYRTPDEQLKMPDFKLNDEETDALVTFLEGLKEEELPKKYHAELTDKQLAIAEGKRIAGKYNCSGCHQFDSDRLITDEGIEFIGMVKLEEETGIYIQLLEDNKITRHKAGETVFIDTEQIKKKDITTETELAKLIVDYHVEEEGIMPQEASVFTPPLLYGEGKKVQSNWVFEFLKKTFDLRPWLDVKMPSFDMSDEEATALAKFFTVRDGEPYPFEFFEETKRDYIKEKEQQFPGYLQSAKKLFESQDVNCLKCHIMGDKMPEGEPVDWAPDLTLAKKRLKPKWIKRWLLDPQSIQPGTKMPKFFQEGEFQEYIPGTPEEQAEVMKDFIWNGY